MNKTTLYIGLNDKDSKRQEISTIEAVKIVTNIITNEADGGTVYEATGIYKHDDGTTVIEKTLRVEIIDAARAAVLSIVNMIKTALNQEAIIIQTESISSEMI